MEYKQIKELINLVNKSELSEVRIEQEDFKLVIRSAEFSGKQVITTTPVAPPAPQPAAAQQPQQQAPAPAPAPEQKAEAPAKEEDATDESNLIAVKSPMIGTFYRSSGPDKDPYVKVGDSVKKGDVVCIIEAMKLFNEIESEVDGKIVKVLVEDASPVEYDQTLFLVEPAG